MTNAKIAPVIGDTSPGFFLSVFNETLVQLGSISYINADKQVCILQDLDANIQVSMYTIWYFPTFFHHGNFFFQEAYLGTTVTLI